VFLNFFDKIIEKDEHKWYTVFIRELFIIKTENGV